MENYGNNHHCAMVEQGKKCCEHLAMQGEANCVFAYLFGAIVVAGLITLIVLQSKILRAFQKTGKKK